MYLYEKLQQLIGTEVELFENRNTGRLEIRPADSDARRGSTGRFIGDAGEDNVTIEIRGVGRPYYDIYPFSQITFRGWDSRVLSEATPARKQSGPSSGGKPSASPGRPESHDWLK